MLLQDAVRLWIRHHRGVLPRGVHLDGGALHPLNHACMELGLLCRLARRRIRWIWMTRRGKVEEATDALDIVLQLLLLARMHVFDALSESEAAFELSAELGTKPMAANEYRGRADHDEVATAHETEQDDLLPQGQVTHWHGNETRHRHR